MILQNFPWTGYMLLLLLLPDTDLQFFIIIMIKKQNNCKTLSTSNSNNLLCWKDNMECHRKHYANKTSYFSFTKIQNTSK